MLARDPLALEPLAHEEELEDADPDEDDGLEERAHHHLVVVRLVGWRTGRYGPTIDQRRTRHDTHEPFALAWGLETPLVWPGLLTSGLESQPVPLLLLLFLDVVEGLGDPVRAGPQDL